MTREFPTVEEVIAIHDELIAEFGGSYGLRDLGGLESALLRPQIGYYDGIIEEAAAMMESLAMNHPFVDGNKRTAFFATDSFLRLNDHFIECDSRETHAFFMCLFANESFRFTQLREWLDGVVRELDG